MGRIARLPRKLTRILLVVACLGLTLGVYQAARGAGAEQLGARSLTLSNNLGGQTGKVRLAFTLSTTGPIGSVEAEFCANDPFPQDSCTTPNGFDLSGATITTQAGVTGFTIANTSTANRLNLTRTASSANAGTTIILELDGVKNPTQPGTFFLRLQTFASTNTTGSAADYGGIAFAIISNLSISAEVPPYLIFCSAITIANLNCANAAGSYINFGELSSSHASSGTSQLLTATNSGSGYSITLAGTTMASGANIINALSTPDVSRPSTSQFGLNVRSNSTPQVGQEATGPGTATANASYGQANMYTFAPGDVLVSNAVPDNLREYTVSYIVNVPAKQAPGVYVSTVTFVCLANF